MNLDHPDFNEENLPIYILGQYPESHLQPLHLTRKEMKDPRLVLDEFYNAYPLPVFRLRLRQLIEDALSVHLCDANDYFNFYYQLERMVEAAFLIYEKRGRSGKK